MEATQTKPRPTLLGKSVTTPVDQRKRKEVAVHVRKPVAIFYVGGAGDKRKFVPLPAFIAGPFRNILDAKNQIDKRTPDLRKLRLIYDYWRGYYEVYGDANIKTNVLRYLPDKTIPVVIVGHSLGGWNGAHLSSTLTKAGYKVELLVTLDPVGEGAMVSSTSDIYGDTPKPTAKYWNNIRARPKDGNFSDVIADLGEQWTIKEGPQMNHVVDVNHADAGIMFTRPLGGGKSAADIMTETLRKLTK